MARTQNVRYVGSADVRVMSVKDFNEHDIVVPGEVTWDTGNKFAVNVADLPEEAVEFLRSQPDFEVR